MRYELQIGIISNLQQVIVIGYGSYTTNIEREN